MSDESDLAGRRALIAYGLPATFVTFSTTLTFAYISKYAIDVLLIAPATVGLVFGLSRIWDGITDPLIGGLSDRTASRFGRRRPWILASAIPIAVAGLALWAPPRAIEGAALTAWFAIALFAYMAALTVFNVPHMALGAELSDDPHTRTRIFGLRQVFATVGTFAALTLGIELLTSAEDPRAVAGPIYAVAGVGVLLCIVFAVWGLRERKSFQGRSGKRPIAAFRDVFQNPHGRLLVMMYFVEHMGTGATSVLSPFVMAYVVQMPTSLSTVFVFYTTAILVMVPVWVWLAGRIGKKRAWLCGMGMALVGYATLFTVGEGELIKMCFVVCLTGSAASAGNSIGPSVQSDVIDWDELETGERKEGAYFSTFTFLYKLSAGLMAMLTGLALSAAGYVENAPQTEDVQFAMRALIGLVPFGCFLVGAAIFSRYSLSEVRHAEIRTQLEARRARADE